MGAGDPIPTVIELAKPLRVEDFRHFFLFLANTLGLRCVTVLAAKPVHDGCSVWVGMLAKCRMLRLLPMPVQCVLPCVLPCVCCRVCCRV